MTGQLPGGQQRLFFSDWNPICKVTLGAKRSTQQFQPSQYLSESPLRTVLLILKGRKKRSGSFDDSWNVANSGRIEERGSLQRCDQIEAHHVMVSDSNGWRVHVDAQLT